MGEASPIRVAVIGAGYWGINHVRVAASLPGAELQWVCDVTENVEGKARRYAGPGVRFTQRVDDILADPSVEAVCIATPATTHVDLACRALHAGKHVLVEKPLALDADGADRVVTAARESGATAMVGHLMLYHPALRMVRELLGSGELGELYYLYATRVNLGRVRSDENALWSLGPHDISILDHLIGSLPVTVAARGHRYLQRDVEDVVFVSLEYAGGESAHVHLSWLDPHKERRLTVVCSKKMVVFDDTSVEKIRIYDKGYDRPPEFTEFGEYLTIRQGDVHIPRVQMEEPLANEWRHFLDCIRTGARPRSDLDSAARVVRVLSAAQRSLKQGGAPQPIG